MIIALNHFHELLICYSIIFLNAIMLQHYISIFLLTEKIFCVACLYIFISWMHMYIYSANDTVTNNSPLSLSLVLLYHAKNTLSQWIYYLTASWTCSETYTIYLAVASSDKIFPKRWKQFLKCTEKCMAFYVYNSKE
jgi:hypothetical protein